MASSQQAHGVNQLSAKEKAAIGEAMKEAQSVLADNLKNAKASQSQLVLATGVMKNLQPRALRLQKSQSWKGSFIAGPSPTMVENTGAFVHQGASSQGNLPVVVGSKGAVIYGHFDKALPTLGWLLAWYKPAAGSNETNKVFVEAGNLERLMNMELSEIEKKLDASLAVSRYWDSDTGAAAAAEIKDHEGNMALIGSSFDQFNSPPS